MASVFNTNNTNKCTCFSDSTLSKKQPPKALAISFFKSHIAMLQPNLTALLEKLGVQHIYMLFKASSKHKQIERLQLNNELIPHSMHIEFTFHFSTVAEQSEEFVTLKEGTQPIIKQC
eukprot:306987-Ditylum_brightwellii.AAC.1